MKKAGHFCPACKLGGNHRACSEIPLSFHDFPRGGNPDIADDERGAYLECFPNFGRDQDGSRAIYGITAHDHLIAGVAISEGVQIMASVNAAEVTVSEPCEQATEGRAVFLCPGTHIKCCSGLNYQSLTFDFLVHKA